MHPGRANGAYFLDKFGKHLAAAHGIIEMSFYCERHLGMQWPRCPVSGNPVGFKAKGKGLLLSKYRKGIGITKEMDPSFRASCERASEARKGEGNPMYGKTPWNKGLPLDDPYRAAMADKRRGIIEGPETRLKHKQNRAAHPLRARHTTAHTSATKEQIAQHTAKMHEHHAFGRESTPHRNMRSVLDSLGIVYGEEHCIGRYSCDFVITERRVAIEVDGDFFHTHPLIYPDGPMCKIQRRTAANDHAKNEYLHREGWTVLRYWESDLKQAGFVSKLKADLVRLSVLEAATEHGQ